MRVPTAVTLILTILAYAVSTFGVQGASHFWLNAGHFAGLTIMREPPLIPLGFLAMIIQGTIFAALFPVFNRGGSPVWNALRFSWALGAFLASYITLGEAGKYAVGSVAAWIAVELPVAAVQYTAFGLLLGLIHRRAAAGMASAPTMA